MWRPWLTLGQEDPADPLVCPYVLDKQWNRWVRKFWEKIPNPFLGIYFGTWATGSTWFSFYYSEERKLLHIEYLDEAIVDIWCKWGNSNSRFSNRRSGRKGNSKWGWQKKVVDRSQIASYAIFVYITRCTPHPLLPPLCLWGQSVWATSAGCLTHWYLYSAVGSPGKISEVGGSIPTPLCGHFKLPGPCWKGTTPAKMALLMILSWALFCSLCHNVKGPTLPCPLVLHYHLLGYLYILPAFCK